MENAGAATPSPVLTVDMACGSRSLSWFSTGGLVTTFARLACRTEQATALPERCARQRRQWAVYGMWGGGGGGTGLCVAGETT